MPNKDRIMDKSYFHRDKSYGLNDWRPVVAFVRALLENSEDDTFCWPNVRYRVLADNSLLSQTFIQYLGKMRDERGVPVIEEKLGRISSNDMALESPWVKTPKHLETICLEALGHIGGSSAKAVIEACLHDPQKQYLVEEVGGLPVAPAPRKSTAPLPPDYPEILKGVRSYHDLLGSGGCEKCFDETIVPNMLESFRRLEWPGIIETLSGDGEAATFKLKQKITDHIHNVADPFSDFGIFLSNPKMEYPPGRRRWADSHTFLFFPVADGSLYDKEYTWNIEDNTITTHFHEHHFQKAVVNPDGKSLTVSHSPLSTGIELRGNIFTRECNSAVRGVWDNRSKMGPNYYTRRVNILTPYKKLYYFKPFHHPVVNQLGIWVVHENERPERFFNSEGECIDIDGVVNELLIPLHEPKVLASNYAPYNPDSPQDPYIKRIIKPMRCDLVAVPAPAVLDGLYNVRFEHSRCGNAGVQRGDENGYQNGLDLNCDGIIDERDREILNAHQGEVYRMNVGDFGYFGLDWLSLGNRCRSHNLNDPVILVCSYDYGAGYEPDMGIVHLFETFEPGKELFVEYFYDKAPEAGKNNIKVYLHPEIG